MSNRFCRGRRRGVGGDMGGRSSRGKRAIPAPGLSRQGDARCGGAALGGEPEGYDALGGTAELARGEITPGEAARIAEVYETFLRTAGTVREQGDENEDTG
jgi:hypothetical protein